MDTLIQTEQKFILTEVSWENYEALLRILADRPIRTTYDRGNLELTSPSYRHERYRRVLGRLLDILAEEQNIPLIGGGSTTFKRQDLERGLEPDECYYLQNAAAILGQTELDLSRDPPPDLAIEIDISRSSLSRLSIYADLGVPEVWRYNGSSLKIYQLQGAAYAECEQSPSFPALPISELVQFLQQCERTNDTTLFRAFRTWVQQLP